MSGHLEGAPGGKAILVALAEAGLSPHAEDSGEIIALCPICDDQGASLRITTNPIAVRCRLGCSAAFVLEELQRRAGEIREAGPRAAFEAMIHLAGTGGHRNSLLRCARRVTQWPTMPEVAFYGPLGEAARAIEPLSEADPAAVLVQLLVAFGNAVGRGPRVVLGSIRQCANLFAVIVGKSSKSRKGTSWENAAEVLSGADESWAQRRIKGGLSSGEGVIHAVRDPVMGREAIREGGGRAGRVLDYQDVEDDQGELDKRLMVVEPEFARTLKVAGRKESILSAVLRDAWDSGHLSVLTKSPYKATGAHISITAHITRDELLREMSACESINGFANRFLWVCARRSKELPFGERRIGDAAAGLTSKLAAAIQAARAHPGDFAVGMDSNSRVRWEGLYSGLSADRPGLVGGVLGRAESQVLRLALVYALADGDDTIRLAHLEAAMGLWSYCEESARVIFGDALGDTVADEILRVLRETPEGMTRDELRNHFDRNVAAPRLTQALALLSEHGLANGRKEPPEGGRGRWAERWFAARAAHAADAENAGTPSDDGTKRVTRVNRVGERKRLASPLGPSSPQPVASAGDRAVAETG